MESKMLATGVSFRYDGQERRVTEAGSFVLDDTLQIRIERQEYAEYGAAQWLVWLENPGRENSKIISDIRDCDVILPLPVQYIKRRGYLPKEGDTCVITMNGMVSGAYYNENDRVSAREYSLQPEYLACGQTKQFANFGARSSDGMMPFFDVTAQGAGVILAIGWTGDWKAEFTGLENGVGVRTGLKNTGFYLKPGEKVRTSSVLLMEYSAQEDRHNKFRRLIKHHFSHKACTSSVRDGLMAFELWGGLPSEEMIKRIRELEAHNIRFEDLWIDAGWYGQCKECNDPFTGDWSTYTGDWEINRSVHPEELADVNQAIREAGMNMMLWLEPERATIYSQAADRHPEWFLRKEQHYGSLILNYGNEEAYDYVYRTLEEYIGKFGISCYRQDFNVELNEYFAENDEPDRVGMTEIRHICGMYRLWDQLLLRFPGLLIDNCSSGGRRIDIETLKRSIPFFRSDYQCGFNANGEVMQVHNAGIASYLPYNGCTTKVCELYELRSAYSSSFGGAFYNAVFQSLTEEQFELAGKVSEEYRSIRRYFSEDFYNHGSAVFDDTSWAIWQYHCPEDNSGIVMAFRRSRSPFDTVRISLKGIEGDRFLCADTDGGELFEILGGELVIRLKEKKSSVIIRYSAQK